VSWDEIDIESLLQRATEVSKEYEGFEIILEEEPEHEVVDYEEEYFHGWYKDLSKPIYGDKIIGYKVVPQSIKVRPKGRKLDVSSWSLEIPHVAITRKPEPVSWEKTEEILQNRSWIWNFGVDSIGKDKARERILFVKDKLLALIQRLHEASLLSHNRFPISVYLLGSYPWTEQPNDIDLYFVVNGSQGFLYLSRKDLVLVTKEVLGSDLGLTVVVVGLNEIAQAARGEDVDHARILRRNVLALWGAVFIAGVDIFNKSSPSISSLLVQRDDLCFEVELGEWPGLTSSEIEQKKEWRHFEAACLTLMVNRLKKRQNK
jgi:hypothetical protein